MLDETYGAKTCNNCNVNKLKATGKKCPGNKDITAPCHKYEDGRCISLTSAVIGLAILGGVGF